MTQKPLRTTRPAAPHVKAARHILQRLRGGPAVPVAAPHPQPGDHGGQALRVGSYNVHKCVGRDGRFDPQRVAAVIGEMKADLVAVQEADRRFGRRYGLLDAETLHREAGLQLLRVSELPDGHGWHGNAILLREGTPVRLRRLALPGAEPRGAVIAELDLPVGRLRVVAAHFGLLRNCRMRQGSAILRAIAEGESMPTLMMGDLNEWRPGRRSALRSLEPFFGPMAEAPASFPARMPVLALDRILGWPNGLVQGVRAHDTPLARLASDHLPLTARVVLPAVAAERPLVSAA
ncbi:endonuclease/exonuclease/phosphatase family protein [Roseomonas elaeocarpi]|uniref:Endonuclease/exonuclease/phosphatase family protein n=1 Tax=Roseomonas elaeocarpi TaxID=907779 RepID=A0ABV6JV60_9PROT